MKKCKETKEERQLIQKQILELLQTGSEAIQYLYKMLEESMTDVRLCLDITTNLSELISTVVTSACEKTFLHIPNRIENVGDCTLDYLQQMKLQLLKCDLEAAKISLRFQVSGLYNHFYREVYSHLVLLVDEDALQEHYRNQFQFLDEIRELGDYKDYGEYKYKVSIIVGAYNNLEYTRKCIESLFEYTPGYKTDWELILKSDGSNDGTDEYFKSLHCEKTFLFRKNIRFDDPCMDAAEGKYTCYFSNDVIATHGWLDNLLDCIESDTSIGMVCPACNFISNYQQVNLNPPYGQNMVQMQRLAEKYNKSSPRLWRNMARLMMFVFVARTDLLRKIGWGDQCFCEGYFGDDAISMKIKRAGYRLVFVQNTFVHHFGSLTYGSMVANDKMNEGRMEFCRKFKFDSWQAVQANLYMINAVEKRKSMTVLCVDTGLCPTGLFLKAEMEQLGFRSRFLLSLRDNQYLPYVNDGGYDIVRARDIPYEREIADCAILLSLTYEGDDYLNVIKMTTDAVKKGGFLYIHLPNAGSFNVVMSGLVQENLVTANSFQNGKTPRLCNFIHDHFVNELKELGLVLETTTIVPLPDSQALQIMMRHLTAQINKNKEEFKKNFTTDFFILKMRKV